MAITCTGYDGAMNETQWAAMAALMGGAPTVAGIDDYAVSVDGPANAWTVTVAAGLAWAHGVSAHASGPVKLKLGAPTVNPQHTYVVLTRDWQNNTARVELVTGGVTEAPDTVLANQPGVTHQQLLATIVTRPGDSSADVYDRRCWTSKPVWAASAASVPHPAPGTLLLAPNGTQMLYDGTVWADRVPLTGDGATDTYTSVGGLKLAFGNSQQSFQGSRVYTRAIDYSTAGFGHVPAVLTQIMGAPGGSSSIISRVTNATTRGATVAFVTVDSQPARCDAFRWCWLALGV